jgi:2-oxoglutarate ferredoxin oxidoreductase subunit delta
MKLWRTPFDVSPSVEPIADVSIDKDRCKGCGFCVEYCPRDVLKMGQESNSKGYRLATVKDMAKCVACGFCELICPEFALTLTVKQKTPSGIKE